MALRWALAGDEEAGALFPDERAATRHVGKGAYAGLEFLHVNARTIINAVPPQSLMPFRYTINPYRGCSHACTLHRTPILGTDTKPMAQVRAGDQVYGTVVEAPTGVTSSPRCSTTGRPSARLPDDA